MIGSWWSKMNIGFIIVIFQFHYTLAILKKCSDQEDHGLSKVCSVNKSGYSNPFPVTLYTAFHLKGITEINEDRNSIAIQAELVTLWNDPGLSLPNKSVVKYETF